MDTSLKQKLKAQAHALKPVIFIGIKGCTAGVIEETNVALLAHELIKIKMRGVEKEDKEGLITTICQQLQATLIQIIGNTAIVYRKNKK